MFKNFFKKPSDWLVLGTIVLIVFLSIGQILRLFFSYEDFAFFYTFQFPKDSAVILASPEFARHWEVNLILRPLFYLLKYKPIGYYLFTVLFFIAYNFLYYKFVRLIYPRDRRLALFSAVLQASIFIGLDAFIWDMSDGMIVSSFLVFAVLTFLAFYFWEKTRSFLILLILFLVSGFTFYAFTFRSFFLFGWLPAFAVFVLRSQKSKAGYYLLTAVLLVLGIFLLRHSMVKYGQNLSFLNINILVTVGIFFKNLSQIIPPYNFLAEKLVKVWPTFPLEVVKTAKGLAICFLFLLVPFWLGKKKDSLARVGWFFSLSFLSALILIIVATSYTGTAPDVWPITHWYYLTMLPMIAGTLAVGILALTRKYQRPNPWWLVGTIVIVNIGLSNWSIFLRWENHSQHLKYFYTTIKKYIPTLTAKDLILINLSGKPAPVNPFVSATGFSGILYLASYYDMKLEDLNYAFTPREVARKLIERNIGLDNLYSVDYIRGDLKNETEELRQILAEGRKVFLGNYYSDQSVEIPGLKLTTVAPLYLTFKGSVVNSKEITSYSGKIAGEFNPTVLKNYLDAFFGHNRQRKGFAVASNALAKETYPLTNLIDGRESTVWIAENWPQGGVVITLDLGRTLSVNRVVWASSRNSPWSQRCPSDYTWLVSADGENFQEVRKVKGAALLGRGQFFLDEFPETATRFLRLRITKTHGAWAPAVDEIEVFSFQDKIAKMDDYSQVKNSILDYLPNYFFLNKYLEEVLGGKVPVKILWKNEYSQSYSSDNLIETAFRVGSGSGPYQLLLPRTGREINALKFDIGEYPGKLNLYSVGIWYPSLENFRKNPQL